LFNSVNSAAGDKRLAIHGHRRSSFKGDGHLARLIRGASRIHGALEYLGRRLGIRVFQDAALVAGVQQVAVDGIGLGGAGLDGMLCDWANAIISERDLKSHSRQGQ